SSQVSQKHRPTVGVIRWDAWNLFNGDYDPISFYLHRALSPEIFHYRLPFYATINSPTNISFNGDLQDVMDQELVYAAHAGLDYWAFDTYCTFGPNCTTNSSFCSQYYQQTSNIYCPRNPAYGLNQYLSSKYNSLMKFTLLLLGSPPCDPTFQERYLDLMQHPQFQTVLEGRPLLYLFQFSDAEANACGGGWSGSGEVFHKFRQLAINRGWDPRPRAQNPVPWVIEGPEHYFQATGKEVQELIQRAVNFTCKYNDTAEAQTIIFYAWNESSENGASLIPSIGNGSLYVDALSDVLPMYC
ncbi:unnamed protein product, partial [Didymodactylos carnosus]